MEDTPLVSLRRRLLRAEVEAHGNAEIARAAKKPDRQIADPLRRVFFRLPYIV